MRTIFTIGYEAAELERFVAALVQAKIQVLADVRAVTVSRKRGFSKNQLASRLDEAGIKYVHYAALGDPKPGREAARAGRFAEFQSIYSRHLSGDEPQNALVALAHVVASYDTCLMCYEREPENCHRSIVAKALSTPTVSILNLYVSIPGWPPDAAISSRQYPHKGIATSE